MDTEMLKEVADTIAQALSIKPETFISMVHTIGKDIDEYTKVVSVHMPKPMPYVFGAVASERTKEIKRFTHGESPELTEMIMEKSMTGTLLAGVVMAVYCMAAKFIEEQEEKEEE